MHCIFACFYFCFLHAHRAKGRHSNKHVTDVKSLFALQEEGSDSHDGRDGSVANLGLDASSSALITGAGGLASSRGSRLGDAGRRVAVARAGGAAVTAAGGASGASGGVVLVDNVLDKLITVLGNVLAVDIDVAAGVAVAVASVAVGDESVGILFALGEVLAGEDL